MDFNLGSGCVSFFINDPKVAPPSGECVACSSSDLLQELVVVCLCVCVLEGFHVGVGAPGEGAGDSLQCATQRGW